MQDLGTYQVTIRPPNDRVHIWRMTTIFPQYSRCLNVTHITRHHTLSANNRTTPSNAPANICVPSALYTILVKPLDCGHSILRMHCPVLILQICTSTHQLHHITFILPSFDPDAKYWPSFENANDSTAFSCIINWLSLWYFKSLRSLPVWGSHTSTNPSALPVTRYCPSTCHWLYTMSRHTGWEYNTFSVVLARELHRHRENRTW